MSTLEIVEELDRKRLRLYGTADRLKKVAQMAKNSDAIILCDLIFGLLATLRNELSVLDSYKTETVPTSVQGFTSLINLIENLKDELQTLLGVTEAAQEA